MKIQLLRERGRSENKFESKYVQAYVEVIDTKAS